MYIEEVNTADNISESADSDNYDDEEDMTIESYLPGVSELYSIFHLLQN